MNSAYQPMRTYGEHAKKDAFEIALNLFENFSAQEIVDAYYGLNIDVVYTIDWIQESISNYIKRSTSQRGAFDRKLIKEMKAGGWEQDMIEKFSIVVPILAIISLDNVQKAFRVRDNYPVGVAPSGGNRTTCEAMNNIIFELAEIHKNREFPIGTFTEAVDYFGEREDRKKLKEVIKLNKVELKKIKDRKM